MNKSLTKFRKIIFFCPSMEEGGVEKNLINICNGISQNNQIFLITANRNKKKKFDSKVKFISSTKNFFNSQSRIIKSLLCVYLLIKNHDNNYKSVIVSFQSNVIAIIISKILKYKVIIRSNQSPNNYAKNWFKRKIITFFFKMADKIVVNSNDFRKEFKKYFNLNSVTIYNPIEKKEKLLKLANCKIKNNFFSKSKNVLNILSIGRLVKQKDHITILKAINLIKKKRKVKLCLVGKGNEIQNLCNYIKDNKLFNIVKIIDYKKNIYPFYKKADVFILSSLYEGLPNTLIEALSLSIPIISTDCKTGPREILKNKYGKLFKIQDYKTLSKLILKSKKKYNHKYFKDDRFDFEKNLNIYRNIIFSI